MRGTSFSASFASFWKIVQEPARRLSLLVGQVLFAAWEWAAFAVWRQRGISGFSTACLVFLAGIPILSTFVYLKRMSRDSSSNSAHVPWWTMIAAAWGLVYSGSVLVWFFSVQYWAHGYEFSPAPIGHLDAVYIAIGIVATVGTGTFTATSAAIRGLVTCQYVVDLLYLAVVLATGIDRLVDR